MASRRPDHAPLGELQHRLVLHARLAHPVEKDQRDREHRREEDNRDDGDDHDRERRLRVHHLAERIEFAVARCAGHRDRLAVLRDRDRALPGGGILFGLDRDVGALVDLFVRSPPSVAALVALSAAAPALSPAGGVAGAAAAAVLAAGRDSCATATGVLGASHTTSASARAVPRIRRRGGANGLGGKSSVDPSIGGSLSKVFEPLDAPRAGFGFVRCPGPEPRGGACYYPQNTGAAAKTRPAFVFEQVFVLFTAPA